MKRRSRTADQVHQYMLAYQVEHKQPPTMREIVDSCDRIKHPSSARYVLLGMNALGLVEVVDEPNFPRRFRAVAAKAEESDEAQAVCSCHHG